MNLAKWEIIENKISSRYGHSMISYGNWIFIFGGSIATLRNSNTFYKFSFLEGWKELNVPEFIQPRSGHASAVLRDAMYVFGGLCLTQPIAELLRYDIHKDDWGLVNSPSIPGSRAWHSMVSDGCFLYVFGGFSCYPGIKYFNDVWMFEDKNNNWKECECSGNIPPPRVDHACCIAQDKMYIFGGDTFFSNISNCFLNDMFCLDLKTFHWTRIEPFGEIPSPRYGHCMIQSNLNDNLILFGGKVIQYGARNDFYFFDTKMEKWIKIENPKGKKTPKPRSNHKIVLLKNILIIYGGISFLGNSLTSRNG